jgi:hypothetical protein
MPVDFPSYTREELDQRARAIVRATQFNERGVRDADVRLGSDYDIKARVLGALVHMIQEHAKTGLRALDPRRAFGLFARQYAEDHGVGASLTETMQAAQPATGYIIARSTTGSQIISSSTQLVHADGTAFVTSAIAATSPVGNKTFTVGHRSRRGMIYHGATAASVVADEVYESAAGEFCLARGAGSPGGIFRYHWTQWENETDDDPDIGDVFTQRFGTRVAITCSTAGRVGNKESKDTLTFVTPPGTVVATAHIIRLTGGREKLTDSQIQNAIRELYQSRLGTLTMEELHNLIFATPYANLRNAVITATHVQTTLTVMGPERCIASSADAAAVQSYVRSQIPPGDDPVGGGAVHKLCEYGVAMQVSQEYAPDWVADPALSWVASGASTTTRVQFGYTISGIEIGDRVILAIVRGASFNEDPCLIQRKVSAVGSNYFDVSEAMPYAPTEVGVSPGGPYADELIAVIDEYFDRQLPCQTSYSYPPPERPSSAVAFASELLAVRGILDAVATETSPVTLSVGEVLVPRSLIFKVWT